MLSKRRAPRARSASKHLLGAQQLLANQRPCPVRGRSLLTTFVSRYARVRTPHLLDAVAPPAPMPEVYLRVCGGIPFNSRKNRRTAGLSPRVRRPPAPTGGPYLLSGSISACAEASPTPLVGDLLPAVYLRVCGGIASTAAIGVHCRGLSPRVRRHRPYLNLVGCNGGSISACAEASPLPRRHLVGGTVYLRVCGGIRVLSSTSITLPGLSPRVRRHHSGALQMKVDSWSISACAEASFRCHVQFDRQQVYLRVCGGI